MINKEENKMKMKKVLSILLAAALTVSVAACGGGSDDTKAPADSNGSGNAGTSDQEDQEKPADSGDEETGIEVEIWGTTGDGFLLEFKTKLANNQGPTIFNQAGGAEIDQLQGYCADLTGLDFLDQFAPGVLDDSTIDGKNLGIPYTVEGFGLVYNKDLCDASTLKSTDDFINLIKEQKAAGVEGFELSSEDYFLIGHIMNTPFALQDDPAKFIADLEAGSVKLADNDIFKEFADMMVAIRENCQNLPFPLPGMTSWPLRFLPTGPSIIQLLLRSRRLASSS